VFFSGDALVSRLIKTISQADWSHIGMVFRISNELFEEDLVLLWESTGLTNLADIQTGDRKAGVMLVDLQQRIMTYPGKVSVRQLLKDNDSNFKMSTEQLMKFIKLREEFKGRSYDFDPVELLGAVIDHKSFIHNEEDLSRLFCSELQAATYQRMGILSYDISSNEYTPGDFATESIPFVKGYSLGETLAIKLD